MTFPTWSCQNVYRWLEPGTGRYGRTDPLGRNGDPNPYGYVGGRPTALIDHLGLKLGQVDPALEELFLCVNKGPGEFRHKVLDWFLKDDDVWDFRVHPDSGGVFPLWFDVPFYCTGSNCWKRPGLLGPGTVMLMPSGGDCQKQAKGLVHEMLEIYASEALGLSTKGEYAGAGRTRESPAHNYALSRDNELARQICCACDVP